MKTGTTIAPNANGVVVLHGIDGKDYTFVANQHGKLTCAIENAEVREHVLMLGDVFYPADDGAEPDARIMIGKIPDEELDALLVTGAPAVTAPATKPVKAR